MKDTWKVYILRCADSTPYTSCTSNLEKRLVHHNKGYVSYTKTRLPIELFTFIDFNNKYKAYDFERYLKSGSGRAFMNKRFL